MPIILGIKYIILDHLDQNKILVNKTSIIKIEILSKFHKMIKFGSLQVNFLS